MTLRVMMKAEILQVYPREGEQMVSSVPFLLCCCFVNGGMVSMRPTLIGEEKHGSKVFDVSETVMMCHCKQNNYFCQSC